MRKGATPSLFARYARVEETLIRASMPRTSVADPEPLVVRHAYTVANRGTSRLVRVAPALTFTMAEVARG